MIDRQLLYFDLLFIEVIDRYQNGSGVANIGREQLVPAEEGTCDRGSTQLNVELPVLFKFKLLVYDRRIQAVSYDFFLLGLLKLVHGFLMLLRVWLLQHARLLIFFVLCNLVCKVLG